MIKIGRIYKIIASQGNEIYVGSTFNRLSDRFREHKSEYKKWKQNKRTNVTVFNLFDNYGAETCKIFLIKEYSVVDRSHLNMYETLWINKLKSINKTSPFYIRRLYMKQYYENNKEHIFKKYQENYLNNKDTFIEKSKQYRKNNRDKINKKAKEYREKNVDKIKESLKQYYKNNYNKINEKNKEYQVKHKDKIGEKKKEYYEKNIDVIKDKNKVKIECECGRTLTKIHLRRHRQSKIHLENLKKTVS
jgi:hypothetical protein